VQAVVDASLATVGLAGFQRRSAHTLSGGERQRLAVAGALAQARAAVPCPHIASTRLVLQYLGRMTIAGVGSMHGCVTQATAASY
jgi:ABC-type hemin transport system ATPase subunit